MILLGSFALGAILGDGLSVGFRDDCQADAGESGERGNGATEENSIEPGEDDLILVA